MALTMFALGVASIKYEIPRQTLMISTDHPSTSTTNTRSTNRKMSSSVSRYRVHMLLEDKSVTNDFIVNNVQPTENNKWARYLVYCRCVVNLMTTRCCASARNT